MTTYTLRDGEGGLAARVLDAVSEAAREREAAAEISLGREAPANTWDLGTSMWHPGTGHLPASWVNEVCPNDLRLSEAPTFNMYRALVEQIQGGVLPAVPEVEFHVESSRGVTRLLTDCWRDMAEKSRLLAELDLCVQHNCNYGAGWLAIHRGSAGTCLRAVHPQLVVFDPLAERPQDLGWVAKLVVRPVAGRPLQSAMLDEARWPDSILPRPDACEVRVELWVRRGASFAGRVFRDSGLRAVIRSGGAVVEEEDWPHDALPLVPVYLLPSERMTGHSLAAILWKAQVRLDKILAVMLSRTARSAGEKYRIAREPGAGSPGLSLTGRAETDLRKPGVQVITSDAPIEMYAPPPVPADLVALFRQAVSDMERLAGISAPYQGIAPAGVTAGVAITALAAMSGRRVNRMAAHLAEALRDFASTWAAYELARRGVPQPDFVDVQVSLEAREEETRRRRFTAALELARAGVDIPPAVLVELIPGLSDDMKDDIVSSIEARRAAALFLDAAVEDLSGGTLIDGVPAPEEFPPAPPPAQGADYGMPEPTAGAPAEPPQAAPEETEAAMEV
ncbi:MAG: hypothetical protein JW909_13070 [Planctomycetes bacterium]|nr:hypothetical protein [Planctomycetota bacterium]